MHQAHDEEVQEDSLWTTLTGCIADIFLHYPILNKLRVSIGRVMMGMDIGSDVLLIISLFANEAGQFFLCYSRRSRVFFQH